MNFDSVSHSKFTRSAASAAPSHTIASVYGKSKSSAPHVIDKSSMIWKDFITGIKRRKALVSKLREAATDSSVAMMVLKRQLLEVRDLTLTLIEDALEIEYRFQMFDPNSSLAKAGSKASRLPPISSFRSMEEKEDIFALADMINDVDILFTIPNIRVMLPRDFPNSRNPFLLGKSVDELASLVAPNPEPGNADEELKVLELLRYKRASRALIRAEAQVMNNLPLTLHDMERLLIKMNDDPNVEKLVRSVCTLLDNDRVGLVATETPELRCMTNPIFNIEGYDLLARLNRFKGTHPMRIDVQVVVRQMLQDCNFDYLDDAASRFLLDWINLILSQSLVRNRQRGTDGQTVLNSISHSGKHDIPERSGMLTKRTLQDRKNNADYTDLASEVSSANYNRGTHEGIYNDTAPRMKICASSPASALAQAQAQIGVILPSDPRGRRGRTSSDEFGTGAPIDVAILAGKRAAKQSSRPSSRQDARSPTAGGYGRDSSSPTGGIITSASQDFPPLHETSSPKHADIVRFDANGGDNRARTASPPRASSSRRGGGTGGGGGGGRMSAAQRKVEEEEAKTKLRGEIEKVVRQMGLATAKKAKNGMTTKDEEDLELDRLSSVRYELHRMQQELLRRQVLDPRHYQVMSVDAIAQAQSGLTVNEINTTHPDESLKQKLVAASANAQKLVTLSEKTITSVKNKDGSRTLTTVELLLDMLGEAMIARINTVVETGGEEEITNESIISGNVTISQRTVLKRDIIAHTKISKLIFNRLTDYLLMDIASARRDLKGKMLQNIFDELTRRAMEKPPLSGNFLMRADRVLMSHKFTEDGVLVDVVIMRNDACDGIVIHCTPLAGIYNAAPHTAPVGPVTILLHDKELQVLLINQYGLFVLSRSKWGSLVMVANWLSGRLKVRKVKTRDTSTLEDEDDAMAMSGDFGDLVLEEPSFVSQVTFDNTGRALNAEGTKESTFNLEHNSPSPIKTMKMPGFMDTLSPQRIKTPMTATGGRPGSTTQRGHSQMGSRGRSLAMLDVQLDRRVDVSSSLQTQWKSRNVPNIAGMEMVIRAWQDLEMLVIHVTLTLPLPHRFNLLKRKKLKEARKSDNLMDMANFSDDDEELSDAQIGQVEPVNIELVYRLTSAELAIFGSAEMIEQKKITLSQNMKLDADQEHPETFIWNVLSRLRILFKGSTSTPFERNRNANDPENWEVQYVRKLVRDVKTVTKGVMVVTASAIGGELLFEAEPLDNSVYNKVGSKIMSELEISETVYTEGWSLKLLDYHQRKDLALKMLDKLKVVDEDTEPRLEIYTFPETRMLNIAVYLGPKDSPQTVGSVEINYHSTLSDVRVLIKHELDIEDVPKQFRFMYKGANCSVKQEPFRRAWESLPMCLIVPKAIDMKESGTETEDILKRREKNAAKKIVVDLPKLAKGQRRVFGKFSAVPVPTLCYVTEGFPEVHLLHNVDGLFVAGDIIRIGNVLGRDYIVMPTPEADRERYPKTMLIGPAYDLVEEADFSTPIQYNLAYPKKSAGKYYDPNLDFSYSILKTPAEQGFDFIMPDPEIEEFLVKGGESGVFVNPADGPGGGLGAGGMSELDAISTISYPTEISGRVMSVSNKKDKKSSQRPLNQPFPHTWIWKCIPAKEDDRPKWRILYDNGSVPYVYEYRNSMDFELHFRVRAYHAYLEVLCTDSRVPDFTLHAQRVRDMEEIPLEFYTQLIFDKMTEWSPQYKKGIERSKFIKLMREVSAFPDLKRSARVSQLEMYFTRVLKSEYGIVSKFISYAGFCHLLKEVALIRFPPPKRQQKEGDDNASVGSLDENASIGSIGSLNEGSVGSLGSTEKRSVQSGEGSESTHTMKKPEKKKAPAYATRKGKRRKLDKEGDGEDMSVGASVVDTDPVYVLSAYKKLVMDYIMLFPDWYDVAWHAAKMMAMKREAIPYCAATRIAAKVRGGQARTRYRFFLRNHIALQSNIRRKLSAKKTAAFVALLRQDWVFRMRYYCALKIQTLVRKFCKRCWFHRAIQKIKDNEYAVQKARRFRLKKLRAQARKGILYKELKRVNGIMVFIRLTRQDTRNYTRDCGLIIEVYVPVHQTTFRFPLDDGELRFYMQLELGVEAVNVGDLLDKRNLQRLVASRLMVHKPNSKISSIQVIFSKHGLGQRGENTLTRGKRIKGEFFVCKVFETGDDISVQCYHRHTCKIFNVNMSTAEMRAWIVSEHRMHAKDELERYSDPAVLHPKNKLAYYEWVLNGITIDTRKGAFYVLFALHLLKSRKKEMILRIQAAWRKALVRPRIVKILDQIMLKVKVAAHDYNTYYLNRQTGATSWFKSKLLGPADIPTQPVCEWVPLKYFDKNGVEKTHYVNPYNGLYTSLVPDEAAKIIQSLIRNFLLRAISMPVAHFVKAGKIYRQAEKLYYAPNKRLAAVINFAMVTQLIELNEELAKKLYAEAVELSEANPLVTRAWGFYMLTTCEPPIKLNRERAHMLFSDARRKDEYHDKFKVAYYLYQFACIRFPRDPRTLVNLAVVQCLLYGNNHSAEKLLRRALAIAPFEERIVEMWNFLKDRFPERQLIYNPNSRVQKADIPKDGKLRTIHGRPVKENPRWAGWVYVEKDTYNVSKKIKDEPYWYNPADGSEELDPPDFAEQWIIRRNRSQYEGERYGLEHYFDPLTSEYFQYHALTKTFA